MLVPSCSALCTGASIDARLVLTVGCAVQTVSKLVGVSLARHQQQRRSVVLCCECCDLEQRFAGQGSEADFEARAGSRHNA